MVRQERIAYFNGKYVKESDVRVAPFDVGVRTGEFVFETIRTFGLAPYRLEDHLDRLYTSLKAVEVNCGLDRRELTEVILHLIDRNRSTVEEDGDLMWNVDVSAGVGRPFELGPLDSYEQTLFVVFIPLGLLLAESYSGISRGVPAVIPPTPSVPSKFLDPKVKNRNRMHYRKGLREARRVDPAAEALLLDEWGFVAEGGSANFMALIRGRLVSPRSGGILNGITRSAIQGYAQKLGIPYEERDIEPYDLLNAEEAFFCSTPYFILPVVSLNGSPIGSGRPGEVVGFLRDALTNETGVDAVEQSRLMADRYQDALIRGSRPY